MSSLSSASVTHEQLVEVFKALGLRCGNSLVIHSSLSSLGQVAGGADTVLDALLEVIGPTGNLMLPAFNYTRPLPEPYFDPAATPGRTGIINEVGRRRPGAVRSLHPTHSVAVIGPDAPALTRDHMAYRAFGVGSPLDRLAQMDGKILLLGVGHVSNSMIHIAEEYARVPKVSVYPDPVPCAKILMPDGSIHQHPLDSSPSCSTAFGAAEYGLRLHGEINDMRLGTCKLQLMSGQALIRRVKEMIDQKADILLCACPQCRPCSGVRANLSAAGRIS